MTAYLLEDEVCSICKAEIVADGEHGPICANGHDGIPTEIAECGCIAFANGTGEPCAHHHPDAVATREP